MNSSKYYILMTHDDVFDDDLNVLFNVQHGMNIIYNDDMTLLNINN